jgi:Tol biopolymer transport system component
MIYFRKSGQGMWWVPESGGEHEELTTLAAEERDHAWPDALPNGKGILFTVLSSEAPEVAVLSLETGEMRRLFEGNVARYSSIGPHRLHVDRRSGIAPGGPIRRRPTPGNGPITADHGRVGKGWDRLERFRAIGRGGPGLPAFQLARRGSVPVWRDRGAGRRKPSRPHSRGLIRAPVVSPDGRKVAFEYTPVGQSGENIWIHDLNQETVSLLTFEGLRNIMPFWNPNGTEVGFSSNRDGVFALFARPVDLSGDARLLLADPTGPLYEASWMPDGEGLVYRWGTGGGEDLWYAVPDSAPVVLLDTPFREPNPAISPDERWLAYSSYESGRWGVYVRSVEGTGGRAQVSTREGTNPVWARRGGEFFYLDTSDISRYLTVATVRLDPDFAVESRERLTSWGSYATGPLDLHWDLSPDDLTVLAIRLGRRGSVAPRDIVVQNFFEELREPVGN